MKVREIERNCSNLFQTVVHILILVDDNGSFYRRSISMLDIHVNGIYTITITIVCDLIGCDFRDSIH